MYLVGIFKQEEVQNEKRNILRQKGQEIYRINERKPQNQKSQRTSNRILKIHILNLSKLKCQKSKIIREMLKASRDTKKKKYCRHREIKRK